jgi:hypothetical protein
VDDERGVARKGARGDTDDDARKESAAATAVALS